jgi:hypothetical protein
VDRHDRQPIAASSRQVDELDVEHDARDPLPFEQVLGRLAGEPLEAALRVLDRPDDPRRGEEVERLAEDPAIQRLARPHVGTVRLDPRTEGHVVVGQGRDEQWELVGRRGHVGVGEDHELPVGGQHARPDGRALATVRDGQDAQPDVIGGGHLGPGPDDGRRPVRAAVVHDEHIDAGWELGRSGRPFPRPLAAPAQVAEQLVEGRTDALRLVEGGQHDGQACGGHRRKSTG